MMKRSMFVLTIVLLAALLLPTSVAIAEPTTLELDVIDYPSLVFDGDRVPITVRISNVGDNQAKGVILESSTEEERAVGDILSEGQQEVTIYLNNYEMGVNEVDLVANYQEGKSATWSVRFEVRSPDQSITLRLLDAPEAIYEGMVYIAQLQIQNLRLDTVAGARIRSGDKILYQVGALEANQAQEIALRIDDYEVGTNHLELVADHELGTAPPVNIDFQVIPADSAVRAYLGTVSSSTYLPETLELSIVIAAAEDAEIAEVELKALNDKVQPGGYYLGGQVAAEEEVQVFQVESLLTGGSTEEEEEVDRAVRGRELKFEVRNPSLGTQSLDFRLTYRLGSKLVEQEFNVGTIVLEAPSVELILAKRVEAIAGDDVVVELHVANDLPVDVQAVRVVPLDDIEMAPSESFIGTMSPDDFLSASFRLSTADLQDGDQLSFKIVYRVGREMLETSPLLVTVHLEEPEESNPILYIVPPLVVVLLVILIWLLRRRRRWTQ